MQLTLRHISTTAWVFWSMCLRFVIIYVWWQWNLIIQMFTFCIEEYTSPAAFIGIHQKFPLKTKYDAIMCISNDDPLKEKTVIFLQISTDKNNIEFNILLEDINIKFVSVNLICVFLYFLISVHYVNYCVSRRRCFNANFQ